MILKDQNEFYKACFDSMQVGILVFNNDKLILLFNSSLSAIFGYLENELQSEKVSILLKDTFIINDFINNSKAEKFGSAIEIIGIQKNGDEIPIEVTLSEIKYNNQKYYKALISDISLKKKKETKILNLTFLLQEEIKLRNEELERTIDQLKVSINSEKELSELKSRLNAIKIQLKTKEPFENKIVLQPAANKVILQKNIDEILSKKTIFKFKKGETIYCKGNLSNHIFLIKKGNVKTFKINEQGKEFITGFYTNFQYFGYASFVKHTSHLENSKAITNVKLYKINKDEIAEIINNNSKILYEFIDILASDLIEIKERLLLLAYASVRKRTARTLIKLIEKQPLKLEGEIKISRSDLASSIGIANETLIRTLHDFKREKLIKEENKKIKIIDINKLLKIQ